MDIREKSKSVVKKIKGRISDMRHMQASDITSGMVKVIIMCWLAPFLALSIVLFCYSENQTSERINDTIISSVENAAQISMKNIDAAVTLSKEASYDESIRDYYISWKDKIENGENETYAKNVMTNRVNDYLGSKYKYSEMIASTLVIFYEDPSVLCYAYSNIAGATYASITEFQANQLVGKVLDAAKNIDTDLMFMVANGHLYMIRNLVTRDFKPFAVIVMEMNTNNVFDSMNHVVWRNDGLMYADNELIGGKSLLADENKADIDLYASENILDRTVSGEEEIFASYDKVKGMVQLVMNKCGTEFSFAIYLDSLGIMNENSMVIYLYVIIILLFIPLLFATVYYFYKNVSEPIYALMYASEKIENGDYGYKLDRFERNQEFSKMIDMFNDMSVSLKESFERIYAEEVAIRDANMQALQAQINPHFLNNTLEIINWKARMSGNDDVSGMIESLGVMMEATMNRKNESFITLSEEMKYVDAYLYIIEQRFGNKFQFEKEIDEDDEMLMNTMIPRLIIQPLVENMVEHGGDIYGNRVGKLKIYMTPDALHIVVENNGHISEEEKARIDELLSDTDYNSKRKNIGIRNVNMRLKLHYGSHSGLTINNKENDLTISEIVIERNRMDDFVNK